MSNLASKPKGDRKRVKPRPPSSLRPTRAAPSTGHAGVALRAGAKSSIYPELLTSVCGDPPAAVWLLLSPSSFAQFFRPVLSPSSFAKSPLTASAKTLRPIFRTEVMRATGVIPVL